MDEQVVLSARVTRIIYPILMKGLERKLERERREQEEREQSQLSARVGDSSEQS